MITRNLYYQISSLEKRKMLGFVDKEGAYSSRKPWFNPQNEQEREERGRKEKRKMGEIKKIF